MNERESIACPLCGSSDKSLLFTKRDKFGIDSEPFSIKKCAGCNFVFIDPRPTVTQMGKFYPEFYQSKENDEEEAPGLAARLETFYRYHQLRSEIQKVKRHLKKYPLKVLDIGCGTGDRLHLLRQEGCDVAGVETAVHQADHAECYFKIPVFRGSLLAAEYASESFDLITLYNVLEHLHDPKSFLQEIRRILKPGGLLVVEVPNRDSWQSKIFGGQWAAVDVPRDLSYFSPQTLQKILLETGFQIQDRDFTTNFWHPPTLVISLFPSLDPQLIWAADQKSGGGGLGKRVMWALATLGLAFFPCLEGCFGRGALMTYYVERMDLKK